MTTSVKSIVAVLLAGACLISTAQMASAASEIPPTGDPGITVNPNASGTKLSGVLTIAYDNLGPAAPGTCTDSGLSMDLVAVLRLARGNSVGTFSGVAGPVCFGDIAAQEALVRQIVATDVIENFFGAGSTATFEVKSVKNILLNANAQPPAVSMDVELAVRE